MLSAQESPSKAPSGPSASDSSPDTSWTGGDDVANSTISSYTNSSTNSSTNGRPYTPSSGPGTPSTALRDLETDTASLDGDQSEADSTSTNFATMMSSAPLPRPKYHHHMARSAAKRDSVMTLPSIQTLRAHFGGGEMRAEYRAGHGIGIQLRGLGNTPEEEHAIGSLGLGRPPLQRPWKEVHLNRVAPAQARAEAAELANAMRKRWGVDRGEPDTAIPPPDTSADVRSVFVDTARAVRRVRSLGLSLAPPGAGRRRVSGPPKNGPAFSTPSRPAQVQSRVASGPIAGPRIQEPTAPVRRAALDLLASLRTFEETIRIKQDAPMVVIIPDGESELVASPVNEDAPSAAAADCPSSASPPPDLRRLSISSARPSNSSLDDSIFSDDEDWNINAMAREAENKERPREPWEDRLVSEDRAYRVVQDGQWETECHAIRDAARKWADAVDRVFGEREAAPVLSWVTSGGGEMERVRAFLKAHLAPEHVALLPAADEGLLPRLSDGYLLVQAFNSAVHTSQRPWGYVPDEDVHDTLGGNSEAVSEDAAESTKEWTFRRVANLTAWAAAIRLRYNISVILPHSAVLAPPTLPDGKPIPRAVSSSSKKKRDAQSIDFDPLLVAKREAEGDNMFKSLILAWVAEATREAEGQMKENQAESSTVELKKAEVAVAETAE